jgi:enterochelin esterase family protein
MQQYRYNFWTPLGADGRLPVLYLLHGGGARDAENSWFDESRGNLAAILDPLLQSRRLLPLTVITPFGRPANVEAGPWGFPELDGFHAYLIALIREVESDPRLQVRTDRAGRAIAGLSMGGWQALGVFLRSPGMFSALGNFSGTVQISFSCVRQPLTFNRPLRADQLPSLTVFYHTCGRQDTRFYEPNAAFVRELDAAGVPNIHEFPNGRHDWPFWQGAIGRFANHLGAAGWGI